MVDFMLKNSKVASNFTNITFEGFVNKSQYLEKPEFSIKDNETISNETSIDIKNIHFTNNGSGFINNLIFVLEKKKKNLLNKLDIYGPVYKSWAKLIIVMIHQRFTPLLSSYNMDGMLLCLILYLYKNIKSLQLCILLMEIILWLILHSMD